MARKKPKADPAPEAEEPGKAGRKSKFKPDYVERAAHLAAMGATYRDMAIQFEVNVDTIFQWRAAYPEFEAAISRCLKDANEKVEISLFRQATGYWMDIDTGKTKVVDGVEQPITVRTWFPPTVAATIYWTKVKMGWRDDGGGLGDKTIEHEDAPQESIRQTARRVALLLYQGGLKDKTG